MKRIIVVALAVAAFGAGLFTAPAVAGSYPTSWYKIFGNSTSCAWGQGSINNTTRRVGGIAKNNTGCSSPNNARRSVPAGYLGVKVLMVNNNSGTICGQNGYDYNTSTASSKTVTQGIVVSQFCPSTGPYYGVAYIRRKSDAGKYYTYEIYSSVRYFAIDTLKEGLS